ncbi:MAG: alpha/beta fold hydrolase [Candidatus Aminicenantes bacterium]|nr:MAG: alpha/beta fold hydrolase [Candidatus Aminicenantes bacterium]
MKILVLALLIIPLATIFIHSQQSITPHFDELITMAKELVSALENGHYDQSVKHFDETMTKLAPPEKMKEVWEMVIKQVGQFKGQKSVWTESIPKYDIVYVTCEFEKAILDIKVVFDKNKKIAGQFFAPPKSTKEYTPPEYSDKDTFSETEVEVGVEGWLLPGTLSLPKGNGPFPALVLVHGSGPNDRDESLGPNKPFRDLAWGLASQNIAVLRYDKRSKVYGQKMIADKNNKLTVYEETIQDVLAAADLLRKTDRIDAQNIYILGHSLGGMLIPRIANADSKNTGFIVMAGPTRPIEDLFVEQIEYLSLLDGRLSDEEKTNLEQIKSSVQKIKSLTPENSSQMTERFIGAGADYWIDLKGYDPVEKAKNMHRPILILQGGRDYQVTIEDFNGWKTALSNKKNVVFKLYPAHNHLLISGKGKCTPAEYQKAGHVDKVVIDDIITWIKKVKK